MAGEQDPVTGATDADRANARWEYAEVRFYRRVTQILFSHEQGAGLVDGWSQRSPESVDPRRSNARYIQLNRQEDPVDVLAALGDDGWELVGSMSVQISLRYVLKRERST